MSEPAPVVIPADVDREDRVLGGLTARQVAILAATGAVLYVGYAATRPVVPALVYVLVAAPVLVAVGALVLGTRDGLSLDRLLVAAVRQRLAPRVRVAAPSDGLTPLPGWLATRATVADTRYGSARRVATGVPLPVQAVTDTGVVDLGRDGLAVVCAASTVNFTLRTPTEQDALVAGFGRWLHSLTAPVQILVRAHRLDLSGQITDLRERASGLPHPALETAALEHAGYLAELGEQVDLLCRQVLLVLREPTRQPDTRKRLAAAEDEVARQAAETRLAHRVAETIQLLKSAGISVVALDAGQASAVLAAACNPDSLLPPNAVLVGPDDVITTAATRGDADGDPDTDPADSTPTWWAA